MQRSDILTRLAVLFAGFQGGKPIDPALAGELVRPLESFPDDVIDAAIWNFRSGAVPGMDKHYPPSIPEIVAESRRILTHKANIENASAPYLPPPPISDAERKRVSKKLTALAAKMHKAGETRRLAELERRRAVLRRANETALLADDRPLAERLRFDRLGLTKSVSGA
jgi:hypothetical protein